MTLEQKLALKKTAEEWLQYFKEATFDGLQSDIPLLSMQERKGVSYICHKAYGTGKDKFGREIPEYRLEIHQMLPSGGGILKHLLLEDVDGNQTHILKPKEIPFSPVSNTIIAQIGEIGERFRVSPTVPPKEIQESNRNLWQRFRQTFSKFCK